MELVELEKEGWGGRGETACYLCSCQKSTSSAKPALKIPTDIHLSKLFINYPFHIHIFKVITHFNFPLKSVSTSPLESHSGTYKVMGTYLVGT